MILSWLEGSDEDYRGAVMATGVDLEPPVYLNGYRGRLRITGVSLMATSVCCFGH